MQRILLAHGPNLNLLGERQPDIYGSTTLPELEAQVAAWGDKLGLDVVAFQSNHEGAIIERLHAARHEVDGLVLNLGAFTHSSYAIHDAVVATDLPAVEVHISNIMQREPWRQRSVTAAACLYAIYGRGLVGYRDALRVLKIRQASPPQTVRYGEANDQVVDVRVPSSSGPHRLAAFVHGGFWRSEWTRDTIDGLAADLASRGWLTANVEYRRLDVGGGWPQTLDDVHAALKAVRTAYPVAGDGPLLVGHSAGSHLALLAAPRHNGTVVGLASLTDLAAAHHAGVGDGSVARFMGGVPEEIPDAYAAASPTPRRNVLLLHGIEDELVPLEQSRTFVERHPAVRFVALEGTGHFELLDPQRDPWLRVVDMLG